jgi:hypothetical protein
MALESQARTSYWRAHFAISFKIADFFRAAHHNLSNSKPFFRTFRRAEYTGDSRKARWPLATCPRGLIEPRDAFRVFTIAVASAHNDRSLLVRALPEVGVFIAGSSERN